MSLRSNQQKTSTYLFDLIAPAFAIDGPNYQWRPQKAQTTEIVTHLSRLIPKRKSGSCIGSKIEGNRARRRASPRGLSAFPFPSLLQLCEVGTSVSGRDGRMV